MTDKIPIGRYTHSITGKHRDFVEIKLKNMRLYLKEGDIVTLDMIEPYESVAVRKVACHLYRMEYETDDIKFKDEEMKPSILNMYIEDAKKIVALVHEAEDADE